MKMMRELAAGIGAVLLGAAWTLLICTVPPMPAQSTGAIALSSVADLTGDGSTHAVAASGTARWVVVLAATSNTANVRVGDSTVSSTRGASILPGGSFMFPAMPSAPKMNTADQYYSLSGVYYYAAVGDKVSVVWGK